MGIGEFTKAPLACRERDGRVTHPRIEAGKFETPAIDRDERAELTIGIGGIWSRRAGRFELCRALALAKAAPPYKVGRVVLASADWMLFLDQSSRLGMGHLGEMRGGGGGGTRTTRLRDTIFGWGSLQLVHFT
jgi:hypothetical protein